MPLHKLQENRSLLGFNSNAGTSGLQAGLSGVNQKYAQDATTNQNIRAGLLANRVQQENYQQKAAEAIASYQSILNSNPPDSDIYKYANQQIEDIKNKGEEFYQRNHNALTVGQKGVSVMSDEQGRPVIVPGNGIRNTITQSGLEAIKNNSGGPVDPTNLSKGNLPGTSQQFQDELGGRYFGYESGISPEYGYQQVGDPNFIKQYTGNGNTGIQQVAPQVQQPPSILQVLPHQRSYPVQHMMQTYGNKMITTPSLLGVTS